MIGRSGSDEAGAAELVNLNPPLPLRHPVTPSRPAATLLRRVFPTGAPLTKTAQCAVSTPPVRHRRLCRAASCPARAGIVLFLCSSSEGSWIMQVGFEVPDDGSDVRFEDRQDIGQGKDGGLTGLS